MKLPRVGGHALDLEAVVALKPDLVMGWQSGNAAASVARLRALGLTVHLSEPGRIEDIAGELERAPLGCCQLLSAAMLLEAPK